MRNKVTKIYKIGILAVAGLLPVIARAQRTPQSFEDVVHLFLDLLQATIPIILSVALLVFFWGLAKMILHGGNERQYAEGRSIAFYGVIALFVMLSVWGIVAVLGNTFLGIQGPPGPGGA